MAQESISTAFLKQLSPLPTTPEIPLINHPISIHSSTVIGRDLSCDIVLSSRFQGVSKQHLRISPISDPQAQLSWRICDLGSVNGTYLNDQRLQKPRILKHDDRIRLGQNGPEFAFEYLSRIPIQRSEVLISSELSKLTVSELLPALNPDFLKKAYLCPGIVAVAFIMLLFAPGAENPVCQAGWLLGFKTLCYNIVLGVYIALACFYVVYQQCGKRKPWWVLVGVGLATIVLLQSPLVIPFLVVFRHILPDSININLLSQQLSQGQTIHPVQWFIGMFLGAGLMEELLKAVPVLLLLLIGRQKRSLLREQIGIWEPLDGILLCVASAVGFTLLETLGQYVPRAASSGEVSGMMLLIPRMLGSIAGHMAYSGYFGYFIGLSVLNPQKRWQLLGMGYLTSATLHAFWNSIGAFTNTKTVNLFLSGLVGVAAYAFLMAAIVSARRLSPNREQNFATRLL